ncbi:hypothetical protein NM688_g7083 [Phlebia brevispora]|uniref:Uncharacterized protein n=1 Tax=Phlebia brevispora TaxID=194682 RepID=A0ACC1S965_9APHY|nr:hypothetical protein NM688_g7083 [Phlebia brevispora]
MVKTSTQNTPQDTPEPQLGIRRKIEEDDPTNRATKKARTRVSYSCGECHRRKQKCDRQIPCSHCIARKVPELCKAYTPGKSDQDLHARLARVEQVIATALPQYWAQGGSGFIELNGNGERHRSNSPSGDDDRASQADEEDVGVFESGRWFGASASGIVAAPAMIEKLPPDIFHSESKALLGPSESSPADNLKRLVQECGVSPHKISELLHELPPRQMTDKLIDFYFTHINWTRYPVSERNFRVGYNSIYAEGASINPNEFRFLPLLFVILAISVRLAPEHIAGDERSRKLTSCRYYWCSRRSLLIAAAIHTDCLEVVLTRLLSARFLLFDRKMTECWSQLGAAVRTAQALGLHRDCGALRLDPYQVEHRRRIWSYLYHADRSYALVLGRPSAIQDDYTSTLPPANVEDQDNVIIRGPLPLTTPTKMTYIVLRHTLSGIMGRMVHHFQKVNTPRHYADVCAIDDDLLKFIQSLPPFYSLDPDTSLDETHLYIPAHRFLLVTEILFVRITLHRPYLLRRLSSDRYLRSRTACFECAMKDFMIRRRFLESTAKDVRDPVTSAYREFQAAMISGIYLVLYPKGKDAETMNMIMDGFIHDHERDTDETTRRELKIVQFLKLKSANILKGSPKTEEAQIASSPSTSEKPHTDAQLLLQLHQQPQQQQQQQPQQQQQRRQARDYNRDQPREGQQQQTHRAQEAKYREQLEQIVQEEREAKNKMPTYKGLENYRLVEKMGDGAFSNVYKAIDLRTAQKVAVKVVRKYELSASQRANILKEVQIMRGINHPSIVKLHSFHESTEHYFLVLELLEGGELFHQIVKLTYFSENLARHVILQVAEGIRYLHEERGVVHRDIKPENLLFDRIPIIPAKIAAPKQFDEDKEDEGEFLPGVGGGGIGRVKIADFGLSKVVWDEQTMTPCGTVGYTAPEIVKDERYSKSVDMWALGCVLYTLLCGFPPFYDESINVLTEKVARGHYTFLSPWWDTISPSAKDLISHLLCVDPAQRYTIHEFMDHPWCKAAPAPAPPPTPGPDYADVPLDSPLLAAVRGREMRSPGLATLKEAFDITYAVHRMEEEGARRRAAKGGANRGFLGGLNEEDEDDYRDDEHTVAEARQRHGEAPDTIRDYDRTAPPGVGSKDVAKRILQGHLQKQAAPMYDGRAGPRDRARKGNTTFELDIGNATLLGRRHRRDVDGGTVRNAVAGGSPLVHMSEPDVPPENIGSPMRVD